MSTLIQRPDIRLIEGAASADICRLVRSSDVTATALSLGLRELNIVAPSAEMISYQDISPWHRGGAETFVSDFKVWSGPIGVSSEPSCDHVIAKAITRIGNTALVWHVWQRRRLALRDVGVLTPEVFSFSDGVTFERFVPFEFEKYFEECNASVRASMADKLLDLGRRVDLAGFSVLSLVDNIRTDGASLFIVDVGEDLGEPSGITGHEAYERAVAWLSLIHD